MSYSDIFSSFYALSERVEKGRRKYRGLGGSFYSPGRTADYQARERRARDAALAAPKPGEKKRYSSSPKPERGSPAETSENPESEPKSGSPAETSESPEAAKPTPPEEAPKNPEESPKSQQEKKPKTGKSSKKGASAPGGKKGYKWKTKDGKWWTRKIPGDPTSERIPYEPDKHGELEEIGEEEEKVVHHLNAMHDVINEMSEAMSTSSRKDFAGLFKKSSQELKDLMMSLKDVSVDKKYKKRVMGKAIKKLLDSMQVFGLYTGGKDKKVNARVKKEFESLMDMAKLRQEKEGEPPKSPEEQKKEQEHAEKYCKEVEKAVRENDVDKIHKLIREGVTGFMAASAAAAIAMFAMSVPLLLVLGIGALIL